MKHLRRDPVLLGTGGLVAACVIGYGTAAGSLPVQGLACWIALLGVHLGLAVTARAVARAPDATRHQRIMWTAMAAVGAVYALGDVVQLGQAIPHPTVRESVLGGSFQTICVLVATGGLVMVMLSMPLGLGSARERTRFWLDVAVVMVAATAFGSYAYVPVGGLAGIVLGLLTGPGPFLVGVFAVVKLILSGRAPFNRLAGFTIGVAAGLEGTVQAIAQALVDEGHLTWLLGLTVIASALLLAGARLQLIGVAQAAPVARPRRERSARFSALPYTAIAATYFLLIMVFVALRPDWHAWVAVGGAVTSAGLVVVRQLAAFYENNRLVDDLDATVQQLRESLAERDRLTAQLHHQAFHDPLTGLANRAMFNAELDELARRGGSVAVMMIDLDEFKPVNDHLGHAAGDELLVTAGNRLRRCVRDRDLVARLGGDEFAVLLADLPRADADRIAARIVAALAEPFAVADTTVRIRASVGVALSDGALRGSDGAPAGAALPDSCPAGAPLPDRMAQGAMAPGVGPAGAAGTGTMLASAEDLLHDADLAMYAAKRSGEGGYRLAYAA